MSATDSAFASVGSGLGPSAATVEVKQQALGELLRRSTLLAHGPNVGSAVSLESTGAGGRASATAEDSVIRATDPSDPDDTDIRALGETGGSASFSATRTAFTDMRLFGAATATSPGEAGNVAGDLLLVDEAALDLGLRPDSLLIDRGSAAGLAAVALDLAGAPCSTDGNADCAAAPDLGAYERPALTPCTPARRHTAHGHRLAGWRGHACAPADQPAPFERSPAQGDDAPLDARRERDGADRGAAPRPAAGSRAGRSRRREGAWARTAAGSPAARARAV